MGPGRARFALDEWHWAFLAQPYPVPERLLPEENPLGTLAALRGFHRGRS